jgi:hypothetical protein
MLLEVIKPGASVDLLIEVPVIELFMPERALDAVAERRSVGGLRDASKYVIKRLTFYAYQLFEVDTL